MNCFKNQESIKFNTYNLKDYKEALLLQLIRLKYPDGFIKYVRENNFYQYFTFAGYKKIGDGFSYGASTDRDSFYNGHRDYKLVDLDYLQQKQAPQITYRNVYR